MCQPSIYSNFGAPQRVSEPLCALTREVLLEKTGHKTNSEKQEWVRTNRIVIYHPNVAIGSSSMVGGGYSTSVIGIAHLNNFQAGTCNTSVGYSTLFHNVATGAATLTGTNNTALEYSSLSRAYGNAAWSTITQEEYRQIGKVGTKKWTFVW